MAWLATPLARSRLVVPLSWECPGQLLLCRLHLLPLLLRHRRLRMNIYGQLMNLRQLPGVQRAHQICYFSLTGSLVSYAQSKSMLLCFLCVYVCVCVCVCECMCICVHIHVCACEAVRVSSTTPFPVLPSRLVARRT